MNITNNDYKTIDSALKALTQEIDLLSTDTQEKIINANAVMINLCEKKQRDNKRIASYIAGKRKDNKEYARGGKKV